MSKEKLFRKWNKIISKARGNELDFDYSKAICSEFKEDTVTLDINLGEKKYLVGQDIFNITNENGDTLLHLAIQNKNIPLAHYLITQGVNDKISNKNDKACFDLPEMQEMLTTTRTHMNFLSDIEKARSSTPMIKKVGDCATDVEFLNVCTACRKKLRNDELNTVKDVYKITDINQRVGDNNETLLHAAILYKQNLFAKELIKRGADIEAKTMSDVRPLMRAAAANNVSLLRKLLASGAEVNAFDKEGNTALIAGVIAKNSEIVENLLKHPEINFEHSNNEGKKAIDFVESNSENDRKIKTMLEVAEMQTTNNTRKRSVSSISSLTMNTDQESMDSPIQQKSKQRLDNSILSSSSSIEREAVLKAVEVLSSFSSSNPQTSSSKSPVVQESTPPLMQQTPSQKVARAASNSELELSSPTPLPKLGRRK